MIATLLERKLGEECDLFPRKPSRPSAYVVAGGIAARSCTRCLTGCPLPSAGMQELCLKNRSLNAGSLHSSAGGCPSSLLRALWQYA